MREQIEEFITHLKNIKNTPENTLLSYKRDLYRLSDHMEKLGITDVASVTQDRLRAYAAGLSEENYAISSIIRQYTSIRVFFKFLVDNGNITENPAENLKSPRAEKKEPRILSALEIESLLSQEFTDDPLGKRDRAILELMYATGLRASELVELKLSNIDLSLGCLRMGEDRLIPYGNKAKEALNAYLLDARSKLLAAGEKAIGGEINDEYVKGLQYVFFNYNGKPMSRQALWKLVKKYAVRAEIDDDITLNDLRHSFGVHLIENGADIASVQNMMGYTGSGTISRYLGKANRSKDPYDWARLRN